MDANNENFGEELAGIGASAPLRLIWAPPRSARDAYQRDYDPATLHRSAQKLRLVAPRILSHFGCREIPGGACSVASAGALALLLPYFPLHKHRNVSLCPLWQGPYYTAEPQLPFSPEAKNL